LKIQQALGEGIQVGEIVRRENLSLNDRKVDLDLVNDWLLPSLLAIVTFWEVLQASPPMVTVVGPALNVGIGAAAPFVTVTA